MKGVRVAPQQDCRLSVQFEPIRNRHAADEPVTTEYGQRIEIKTGNAVKVVSFDVTIDCRNIIFSPSVQMSTFTAKVGSSPLIFGFSAPQLVGKYDAFVEVSQKNRLIQVIPISIFVMDGSQ